MSLEVIYVTRHGFRSNWLVNPSTGDYTATIPSPTGIPADPALTAHGIEQAREMGTFLATLNPPIDAVYSSPYYRCLQTIMPFITLRAAELKSSLTDDKPESSPKAIRPPMIRPEHGLAEWFGSADFKHPSPASAEMLKSMFPAYDETYKSIVRPSSRGETIAQLHDRVALAMQGVIDQCDREGIRAIVLCTHAAVVIALGRVLTGVMPESIETEDFMAYTCGLSAYRRRRHKSKGDTGDESGIPSGRFLTEKPDLEEAGTMGEEKGMLANWRNGQGVRLGWDCFVNSDCRFLTNGEERGWRFSGDESFKADQASSDDAGAALGVVVEKTRAEVKDRNRKSPSTHRL